MAKVQIKFDSITPFGGIFSIMEQFDALLSDVIDSTLGINSTQQSDRERTIEITRNNNIF